MLQLATFSQSGTKATYDPLPGVEAGDEQLPLYNVGASADGPPILERGRAQSSPLPTAGSPLHTIEEDSNQPRTDAEDHASSAPPQSSSDPDFAFPIESMDSNDSSGIPVILCSNPVNVVWYTLHGLRFAVIGTLSAFFVGGISTGFGLVFLNTLEPYKTVFFTDDDEGGTRFGHGVWVFLLGSGVCGATVGLLTLFLFAGSLHNPILPKDTKPANRRTEITDLCVFMAFVLGPVAGLFAEAIGVALAPASVRLPEQYTAMHALGATFCGISPFLAIFLLFAKF